MGHAASHGISANSGHKRAEHMVSPLARSERKGYAGRPGDVLRHVNAYVRASTPRGFVADMTHPRCLSKLGWSRVAALGAGHARPQRPLWVGSGHTTEAPGFGLPRGTDTFAAIEIPFGTALREPGAAPFCKQV